MSEILCAYANTSAQTRYDNTERMHHMVKKQLLIGYGRKLRTGLVFVRAKFINASKLP